MKIILTENDLDFAKKIARKRNKENRRVSRKDGKVLEDSLGIDIQGSIGELAVSKALNIPWNGQFFPDKEWLRWRKIGCDVGPIEVRSTKHAHGSLILHERDKNNSPFVLVLQHKSPMIYLAGWCWGFHGKKQKWWKDVGYGRPCFYVPQKRLRPMNSLIEGIKKIQNEKVRN